jgi:hypothetical protein
MRAFKRYGSTAFNLCSPALSRFCRVYRPITIPQNNTATMPLRLALSAMVYARCSGAS